MLAGKPIKELSISIVNRELLDDLQTMNIAEAMPFSASFSPESGLVRGHGAQMNAEGQFTNRVGNSTNGVPESGAVERIELIKGPPSVLMSSASAGGAVNITPKRPKGTNFAEAEFQYGNFQTRYRTEINRGLSRRLGTRIGIQYTEADFNGGSLFGQSNLPEFDRDRRLLIFNSTEWRPWPNTVLGVDLEQVRDRARPGIVYQINPAVGIYSSFLESFQVPTNANSFNELLPNREGVSYETGIKIDLYDRKITGTFSYFDTTDKNRSVTDSSAFNVNTRDVNGNGPRDTGFDPNNLAANTSRGDTVAVGEYNSKGWDFEVTLALARGRQAMLSATLVEAAVTQDPNPSFIGQKNGGFAERNYGAVVSYRFLGGQLKRFALGSGYRYTSERYLSRVRQFTTVVGSPFVDYWQPSAQSLLVFAKYGFNRAKAEDNSAAMKPGSSGSIPGFLASELIRFGFVPGSRASCFARCRVSCSPA